MPPPPRNVSAAERSAERLRAVSDQGVLLVYDAALPADATRIEAGYVAYWNDFASGALHVYGRLLFTTADVGQAALDLERDLDIDLGPLIKARPALGRAIEFAEGGGNDGLWAAATYERILVVMGFEVTEELLAGLGFGRGPTADPAIICVPVPPPEEERAQLPPPDRGSPRDVIGRGVAYSGCGGDGGGGDPSGCVCCAALVAVAAETPCCQECCGNQCDDGDPCTEDDVCGSDGCQGTPKDCDDGDPCTGDVCVNGACVNDPLCGNGTCCPTGGGILCCPQANAVCCHNPDHCCASDETCCGDGCCGAGDTCCHDQCGPKGACCFFDSGACSEKTSACCAEQGGVYQGKGTSCTPGDLCRPECENCHTVNLTFYECGHYLSDPWGGLGECDQDSCFKNVMDTASCDPFPYRLGPAKCDTHDTGIPGEVVNTIYTYGSSPEICVTPDPPGPMQVWQELYSGCGEACDLTPDPPYRVRCPTGPCGGEPHWSPPAAIGTKKACGCP